MRMLILSFYYAPDLSAGSFRTTALVRALREVAAPDDTIEVMTTLPNRYHTFSSDAREDEVDAGVHIHRIQLPGHRSDMRGQSRAFAHFASAVRKRVAGRRYDLVFATSSRLMTAALGAWIARRQRSRLYLDIRDIFVDTITDLLPGPAAIVLRLPLDWLESWTMRRADRINLVSPGFEGYFRARYPRSSLQFFTNGVDDEFVAAMPTSVRSSAANGLATVLYAGNIGEGQGLHAVLPDLARALRGRARFVVIGDGGRREALEQGLARASVTNVELRAPVSRDKLLRAYQEADVLFLHLGDHAAFEKVLPSKVFEYAALGKPILAGVAGYAAQFMREQIENAAVFAPGDVDQAVRAFGSLAFEERPRAQFVSRYARANIVRAMAADILAVGRHGGAAR